MTDVLEALAALERSRRHLSADFFDVRKGMPLVAQYVAEEGRKHNCTNPKDLYPRYLAQVRDLQEVSA